MNAKQFRGLLAFYSPIAPAMCVLVLRLVSHAYRPFTHSLLAELFAWFSLSVFVGIAWRLTFEDRGLIAGRLPGRIFQSRALLKFERVVFYYLMTAALLACSENTGTVRTHVLAIFYWTYLAMPVYLTIVYVVHIMVLPTSQSRSASAELGVAAPGLELAGLEPSPC
jgi:hypothetical protein